jgi:hypothetical protein
VGTPEHYRSSEANLGCNEGRQPHSEERQRTAPFGYHNIPWNPRTYAENISKNPETAGVRTAHKSEPWAVGKRQVQMNTVSISGNRIAG